MAIQQITVTQLSSNGSSNGQVLSSNGTAVYWANTSSGGFSNGQSILVQDIVVSGNLTMNTTSSMILPIGNTTQRPAGAANGEMRINSSTSYLEVYYNGRWTSTNYLGGIVASGGTITYSGAYKIHTFTTSDSFILTTIPAGSTMDVLIVAGGGGGGGSQGTSIASGGGGAGGLVYLNGITPVVNSYAITIGAGSPGSAVGFNVGYKGSNTTALGYTAIGGGGGGTWTQNPSTGGSGGGAGENDLGYNTQAASIQNSTFGYGYGFAGGVMTTGYDSGTPSAGSGGGGAGGVGSNNTSSSIGGAGGVGRAYDISGSTVYYAGGGGGGGSTTAGAGGNGGGGSGRQSTTGQGTAGTVNTGGGGGGSLTNASETAQIGGLGGSGIVIIRYLM